MNEVVMIEGTEIRSKFYNGQRVVTLKDIDQVHKKKDGTGKSTFNRYKKHFVENEDYFKLTRKELRDILSPKEKIVGNPNIETYLITESGYLMIVKAYTDDLAWKVQRRLVNAYFREQEEFNPPIEKFPEEQPRITYQTSSTPVPKNPSWQARNRRRINALCEKANTSVSNLYHHVLLRLGEEYDLNAANRIYEEELGHCPKYAMDIVSYFPELARMADTYLDKLEEVTEKKLNNE